MMVEIPTSKCRWCRKDIIWGKRVDGGWHAPLDAHNFVKTYHLNEEMYVIESSSYRLHACNPKDVHNVALASAEVEQRLRDRMDKHGWIFYSVDACNPMAVGCPSCGADAGASCENLNLRKQGKLGFVKHPHESRVIAGATEQGLEKRLLRTEMVYILRKME